MYANILSLNCEASYSCSTLQISAEYSPFIDWRCIGSYSCRDSMIWHHNTDANYFSLDCDGYYACDDIYAIVSAKNVAINCADSTDTCGDMQLFCKYQLQWQRT